VYIYTPALYDTLETMKEIKAKHVGSLGRLVSKALHGASERHAGTCPKNASDVAEESTLTSLNLRQCCENV